MWLPTSTTYFPRLPPESLPNPNVPPSQICGHYTCPAEERNVHGPPTLHIASAVACPPVHIYKIREPLAYHGPIARVSSARYAAERPPKLTCVSTRSTTNRTRELLIPFFYLWAYREASIFRVVASLNLHCSSLRFRHRAQFMPCGIPPIIHVT